MVLQIWRVAHILHFQNISLRSELSQNLILALSLTTVKSNHKPSISILDLPQEIQCEIFTRVHRDNSKMEASRLPVEVVLSHVCSEWRNIAIHLPTLWTAFKFDTQLRVSDPFKKLEEYLSRSRTQLLELYFSFSSSDYKDPVLNIYDFFERDFALVETAIAHACRWHRFTLFADEYIGAFGFRVIDRFDKLFVPNLEYIALCVSSYDYPWSIGGAPRLCALRIDAPTPFRSPPPLSNITTLAIQDGEPHFELQDFHSILTIPTLTNLSIETRSCLDTYLTYNPSNLNLLSIKMPSLKILRITQDSNILGILSFLDAPLLETLVLHNVDLTLVDIDQHIHEITTFIRLDTIALLDCRYQFEDLYDGVDIVDMILHTIACRATHVIISSPAGPSFIEEGSKLLDFNRYGWSRLQRLTLDLSTFAGPLFSIGNFERSPHSLTVRVVKQVLDHWRGRGRQCDGLMTLEKPRKLETMRVGDLMMDEPWPAPGGLFQEDGNLENRFIWGETLRAKGPNWLRKKEVSQPFLLVWC
jgi:hypothetical protein